MGTRSRKKKDRKVARGKVRRLEFDGNTQESKDDFRNLYTGFSVGASAQERRSIETQACEAEILRKLWAISNDNPLVPENVTPRNRLLKAGELAIEFTDQEWTVLLRYFNSDRISWTVDTIGGVVALRQRLQAIELTEPED